ncbi:hypothetical protein CR513_34694, partial [Mucuna pruriens]
MEFGDTLIQFNIFEAMKHLTEDHSLFGIDMIEELPDNYSEDIKDSTRSIINCLEADHDETLECTNNAEVEVAKTKKSFPAQLATIFTAEPKSANEGRVKEETKLNSAERSNSKAGTLAEVMAANEDQTQTEVEINAPPGSNSEAAQEVKAISNLTRTKAIESSRPKQPRTEIIREQVGQTDLSPLTEKSPSLPPMELKPSPSHLKYAYLDIIIANNLLQKEEDKLLKVLRQHEKVIGWKLFRPSRHQSLHLHA